MNQTNRMNKAISIKKMSHYYDKTRVLKNLSFCVQKGDFFIIIGPNGSGKTTLMKAILKIEKSSWSLLEILGRPISKYTRKALARTIAFVPQMTDVDFPFTAVEVVLMGRSPHTGLLGMEREKDIRIANQAMAFTGVKHLANRRLDQLSGGERQRVFIARSICQQTEIILLDEPTASLDLAHQIRVMDLMEKLKKKKGTTIVMVSHDVNLAAMYGDRILLLKDGEIVCSGSPGEVLNFETLEQAYGCTLLVDENPLGKFPRITQVPQRYMDAIGKYRSR